MWIIIQQFPNDWQYALWLFVTVMAFYIGVGAASPWWLRQITGIVLWTDTLNMITVGLFNALPTWWWPHGWTLAMLPYIGWFLPTTIIWILTVLWFGGSLWTIGLGS